VKKWLDLRVQWSKPRRHKKPKNSITMEQTIYSDPAHNLGCRYRFTCGAVRCPKVEVASEQASKPPCYVDKFKRYQPDSETLWYYRGWDEVKRITWREVFSLQESWIYTLLLIIIVVFIFMAMLLIYVLLKLNRYY
jgi:hypothetical protein